VNAERTLGIAGVTTGDALIRDIASRRSVDMSKVKKALSSTEILRKVDEHRDSSLFLHWQLCSGFAHGRRWASLSTLRRTEIPNGDPDVASLRFENSVQLAFLHFMSALHLVDEVIALHRSRATK
jgi:hypothetical protein